MPVKNYKGYCTYSHAVTNATIQLIECFPL